MAISVYKTKATVIHLTAAASWVCTALKATDATYEQLLVAEEGGAVITQPQDDDNDDTFCGRMSVEFVANRWIMLMMAELGQ